MVRIIYIDDDKKWQDILKFSLPDYSIVSSFSGYTGFNTAKGIHPDLIILNKNLPDMEGVKLLDLINSLPQPPPVIILGNCDNSHDIVKLIQHGAVDYFTKPYNLKNLKKTIERTVQHRVIPTLRNTEDACPELKILIGESEELYRIKQTMVLFSQSQEAVLLSGETGTGKDIIAGIIHRLSRRKSGPYKVMHTGAIPFSLLDSHLYGTEKGAFTGAQSYAGYFEQSNRGTLFLDEIGEISPTAQVKLLRILEDKEIVRIGGSQSIPIDVRIISATNIDIGKALKKKRLRNDLYYRINTLPITIPPLRKRIGDIPSLVHYFLEHEHYPSTISNSALSKLMDYSWPGNIRELRNVVNRAVALSCGREIKSDKVILGFPL